MNNTHISHAKKLIIGAWIVEILAFLIGIAIALLNIGNKKAIPHLGDQFVKKFLTIFLAFI